MTPLEIANNFFSLHEQIAAAREYDQTLYCPDGQRHEMGDGACGLCDYECEHETCEIVVEDASFDYAGTHATAGLPGVERRYAAYYNDCGGPAELPEYDPTDDEDGDNGND